MTNAYLIRIDNRIINMNAITDVVYSENSAMLRVYLFGNGIDEDTNVQIFEDAEAEQLWGYLCSLTIKDIEVKTE